MTDRERLIELFSPFADGTYNGSGTIIDGTKVDDVVNNLLANGITVPPVSIGTIVYEIRAKGKGSPRGRFCDYSVTTNYSLLNAIDRGLDLYIEQKLFVKTDMTRWNKTVFLTKEEAKEKLREKENECANNR